MRNLGIVILVLAIVAAGAFAPQLALAISPEPELDADYRELNLGAESSSDYAWRLERIAAFNHGNAEDLLTTYVPIEPDSQEYDDLMGQLWKQLGILGESGILSQSFLEQLEESAREGDVDATSYYLFDRKLIGGMRILVTSIFSDGQAFSVTMDQESGKICTVTGNGVRWGQEHIFLRDSESRYDILRRFADYLGLSQSAIQVPTSPDEYYESITAERLAANLPGSESWLETRLLRSTNSVTVCIYRGK